MSTHAGLFYGAWIVAQVTRDVSFSSSLDFLQRSIESKNQVRTLAFDFIARLLEADRGACAAALQVLSRRQCSTREQLMFFLPSMPLCNRKRSRHSRLLRMLLDQRHRLSRCLAPPSLRPLLAAALAVAVTSRLDCHKLSLQLLWRPCVAGAIAT
jgi:hypothetical protein